MLIFAACNLGAAVCFLICFFLFPALAIKPRKFAILYVALRRHFSLFSCSLPPLPRLKSQPSLLPEQPVRFRIRMILVMGGPWLGPCAKIVPSSGPVDSSPSTSQPYLRLRCQEALKPPSRSVSMSMTNACVLCLGGLSAHSCS